MKISSKYHRINSLIAALAVILLFVLPFSEKPRSNEERLTEFEELLSDLTISSDSFLEARSQEIFEAENPWDLILYNELIQQGWEMYIYELDELVCWSSNEFLMDSSEVTMDTSGLYQNKFGWQFVNIKGNETSHLIAVYPMYREGTALVEEINRMPDLNTDLVSMVGGGKMSKGFVPFDQLEIKNEKRKGLKWSQWLLVILLLVSIIPLFSHMLEREDRGVWRIPVVLLILRYALYKGYLLPEIQDYELFNPGIYASSFLLPSIGDLLLHSLVAISIALAVQSLSKQLNLKLSKALSYGLVFLVMLIAVFLADLQFGLIEGLIIDSNISYDIINLQTIKFYSVLAILLIALNALSWFILIRSFLILTGFKRIGVNTSWILGVISILVFYTFQHLDASRTFSTLYQGILFFGLMLFWLLYIDRYKWKNLLLLTFSLSLLTSLSIRHFDSKRDEEHLKFHASKLVSEKDLEAEYQFEDIETKLVAEFLNPENFEAVNRDKDEFEKRMRHLYFASSLNQYEVKVLSFDSEGQSIDSFSAYDFAFLDGLYNDAYPTISKYFYQIKKPSEINGYVAKFENCDQDGHYGNVFLLLEPKVIQSTYVYPPLLQRKVRREFFSLSDYSFAIYDEGQLLKQKGDVAYELHYNEDQLKATGWFGRYSHFISPQSENTVVVLSRRNSSGLKLISTISFSFLFYCLVIFAGVMVYMLLALGLPYLFSRNTSRRLQAEDTFSSMLNDLGLGQKLLSVRIQLIMASLIFAGLLASVFFTIKYLEVNHNQRSREDLSLKINEVVNQIQNEPNLTQKMKSLESVQLITSEVSDIHKVEANIFDSKGMLLASSKPEIYNRSLFAETMEADAFYQMNVRQVSQLVHKENIRGFEYLSAYMPLFDEQHGILGYINLPYFIGQTKLNREISTYTITFVNLYLLLFALALALAYFVSKRITRPLKIIQEKISTTSLGSENEMIEWKGSDEIGQLIKQYNKMVLELESSAEKLSASEREGAWKEMARQVAHEIKNPLTPMKLNIQHLQRAWNDDHPKLQETFKKVTRILIEQIESLSRLASEFSSFAQMPTENFEEVNVHQVLLDTLTLFESSETARFIYDKQVKSHMIHGDKEQLGRVFNNTIKNAIQAIPDDRSGIITVNVESDNRTLKISIKDNGVGIDDETAKNVFVPRFSTKNSGMGLGMPITKKIIDNHGGKIQFKSKLNRGTTFFIELPLSNNA